MLCETKALPLGLGVKLICLSFVTALYSCFTAVQISCGYLLYLRSNEGQKYSKREHKLGRTKFRPSIMNSNKILKCEMYNLWLHTNQVFDNEVFQFKCLIGKKLRIPTYHKIFKLRSL